MKLKQFIRVLEKISQKVENPKTIDVRMADYTPVVNPILAGNTVIITDVEEPIIHNSRAEAAKMLR